MGAFFIEVVEADPWADVDGEPLGILAVTPGLTVRELKERIERRGGLPASMQVLKFGGKDGSHHSREVMRDGLTLAHYNVTPHLGPVYWHDHDSGTAAAARATGGGVDDGVGGVGRGGGGGGGGGGANPNEPGSSGAGNDDLSRFDRHVSQHDAAAGSRLPLHLDAVRGVPRRSWTKLAKSLMDESKLYDGEVSRVAMIEDRDTRWGSRRKERCSCVLTVAGVVSVGVGWRWWWWWW